jgi:hypothetical protein
MLPHTNGGKTRIERNKSSLDDRVDGVAIGGAAGDMEAASHRLHTEVGNVAGGQVWRAVFPVG